MLSQIDHVGVILQVVGHGVAETILALADIVELDLRLMIGGRVVIIGPYSIPLLLDQDDQAEGVPGRLEGIKVGPVSDLASEVLVAAPQDGGGHLM